MDYAAKLVVTTMTPDHMHVYQVRPRKDKRGVDLISDLLPFGRLWYEKPDDAVEYAMHCSRSHDAVIRVYDERGNVIETHERGRFQRRVSFCLHQVAADDTALAQSYAHRRYLRTSVCINSLWCNRDY